MLEPGFELGSVFVPVPVPVPVLVLGPEPGHIEPGHERALELVEPVSFADTVAYTCHQTHHTRIRTERDSHIEGYHTFVHTARCIRIERLVEARDTESK